MEDNGRVVDGGESTSEYDDALDWKKHCTR